MTKQEKFKAMAMAAEDEIEAFRDFFEDKAISWAYRRMQKMELALNGIAAMKTPHCDNHISVAEMQRIARTALNDV